MVCMGTNQTSELVSHGLVKCDGDKGMKEAFKEAGLARWGCTNHGVANVAKHSGRRGQGEVYRCCARAGNKSKWSYFYNKLTDNIKAYLERSRRVNIEEWSIAHNTQLEQGGCIDFDTTNNSAEQTNQAILGAREMGSPMAAAMFLLAYEAEIEEGISQAAHKCTHEWPPNVQKMVAQLEAKADLLPNESVRFTDRGINMSGIVTSKHGTPHKCKLIKIKDSTPEEAGRVVIECECGWGKVYDEGMANAIPSWQGWCAPPASYPVAQLPCNSVSLCQAMMTSRMHKPMNTASIGALTTGTNCYNG